MKCGATKYLKGSVYCHQYHMYTKLIVCRKLFKNGYVWTIS